MNLARAIADASTDSIQPAGAAPVGGGGPLVGPYVAAAGSLTLAPATGPSGTSVAVSSGGGAFDGSLGPGAPNVSIRWDGTINTLSGTQVTTCSTNGGGNITGTCSFAVPAGAAAGSHTVVATQSNKTANSVSATFTVTVSGPTKLAFTTPARSGAVNDCLGPISVQTQNATNAPTNPTTATVVGLASDGSGAFFSDSACGTALTAADRTIGTTANSFNFYYKPTAVGIGTHTITASSAPLTSATQAETVTKASQATLSITAPSAATFGDVDAAFTTSGGSGTGAVTFSAGTSTACSIVAGKLHVVLGTGTCSVTATKAGDADYLSTTSALKTITISKASQATLSITAPSAATFGDVDAAFTTSGGSGTGAVTFSAGTSTACSIVAGKLHVVSGTGTCSVTATKAGDADYLSTTSALKTITISKASQATLSITAPSAATFGDVDAAFTTSGGSGTGAVTFSAGTSTACSIVAGKLHVVEETGTCSVTATKAGDADYLSTTSAPKTITIAKHGSTVHIVWANSTYDGSANAASATASGIAADGDLSPAPSLVYYSGSTATGTPLAGAPTDAGTYTVKERPSAGTAITSRPRTRRRSRSPSTARRCTSSGRTRLMTGLRMRRRRRPAVSLLTAI